EFGRPVASIAQTVQTMTFTGRLAKVLGQRTVLRVSVVAHGVDGLALYYLDMYVPEGAPPLAVGGRASAASSAACERVQVGRTDERVAGIAGDPRIVLVGHDDEQVARGHGRSLEAEGQT
ncbi:MAG: hypothetical protein ACK515_20245, partial [bacterium]